jgi:hypothetical protein
MLFSYEKLLLEEKNNYQAEEENVIFEKILL